VTVLDDDGKLKPEAVTILEQVAEADACLATGHLSMQEVALLQDAAIDAGVRKFLVTHVNWALGKRDLDVQRQLIAKGAYLEYVAISCVSPTFYEQSPHELAGWIMETKGDHIILSSDLGQGSGPPHPEGIRMLLWSLLDEGVPADYLQKMTQYNPAFLTGLNP
jgi:predicted metal-dependent phosphotriesterase family hydrolase